MWATLIDSTAALNRLAQTQDASGGTVTTSSQVIASVGVCIQPASSRTIEDYARRDITIDTMIYSVYDFDSLLSGGLKLNDIFVQGGFNFIVQGIAKQLNLVLSSEPLYEIVARRTIAGT